MKTSVIYKLSKRVLFLVMVIVFSTWSAFPLYWMIKSAIAAGPIALSFNRLVPPQVSTSAFRDVLTQFPFFRWLGNSLIVSGGSTAVAILSGCLAGYSLSRYRSGSLTFFGTLLYFTQLLPHIVLLVPVFILFDRLGLRNSIVGLVMVNSLFLTPIATWLLKGYFDSSPVEIEEAARIDGCSRLGTIFTITVRMNLAGIFATSLFVFLDSWYEWLFAATLIDRQERWTISASIFVFIGEMGIDWKQMMAAGVLATVPTLLIFGVLQRAMMKEGSRVGTY